MGWRTMAEWECIQGKRIPERDVLQGLRKNTQGSVPVATGRNMDPAHKSFLGTMKFRGLWKNIPEKSTEK
ncbi:hypothetical protein DPF_2616 [Desulfoplanes formicivorans]|uniref:Uncharacterized protein n=1 Tax=Desulfoplanes formicivorans TaxID=1592317 RepID=A0A194AKW0_9BACT|nr:hypothetical protein DPF_2616 [Desulfoplanes formicivorans]